MKRFVLFFFLFLSLLRPLHALSQESLDTLSRIPVQSSGRVKPFETFARETLRMVAGAPSWKGQSSVETLWNWMAQPEEWSRTAMIPVSFRPLRQEFGVMLVENRLSPEVILDHKPFTGKVQEALDKKEKKMPLSRIEKERLSLYERAYVFRDIASGEVPGWIPHPENVRAGWLPYKSFASAEGLEALHTNFPRELVDETRSALAVFLEIYRSSPGEDFTPAARKIARALEDLRESRGIELDSRVLEQEFLYNRWQPFAWSWKFYFLSLLLGLALQLLKGKVSGPVYRISFAAVFMLFTAGFMLHSLGFYWRCSIAGRPAVSNMYESIIWVSWAVCFFAGILFWVYRSAVIFMASSAVAAGALLVAESFPAVLDPSISPLVPVLRSNLWLSVHVLTITLSYGAFALAWGLGHVAAARFAFSAPGQAESATNLNLLQFIYRALQIGVILLAAGTVLGGVWANYSWGRFWGWDPKETWALIALLGYLVVLHGRFAGWIDAFGLALGSVAAFALVVMAWYGVNFVLAAGLHSYGFGGGGAPYVFSAVLLDLAAVAWMSKVYYTKKNFAAR